MKLETGCFYFTYAQILCFLYSNMRARSVITSLQEFIKTWSTFLAPKQIVYTYQPVLKVAIEKEEDW